MDSDLTLVIASTFFLLLGAKLWQKSTNLIVSGKRTQAVIFKNNYSETRGSRGMYFPVVRFLTAEKEWITQELSIGQNPPMKEGKKVQVIYDPDDPSEVEINTAFRLEYFRGC